MSKKPDKRNSPDTDERFNQAEKMNSFDKLFATASVTVKIENIILFDKEL